MGKKPKINNKKEFKKEPIIKKDRDTYINKSPLWSFKRLDDNHAQWKFDDISVINNLKAYEGLTWQGIQSASGGKKEGHGSNSHSIPIYQIIKEAQDRLKELNLDNEDTIFSLRVGAKKRLWGFVRDNGSFEIIWYDKNHEIYQQ